MRLLKLLYLLAQHPFHFHRWLVQRGLYQGWIKDFIPFWDTIRPQGLPIRDYTSYTWLEYWFTQHFRTLYPTGDHFDNLSAQYARLLSFIKRRETQPLRCLKQAWVLRHCDKVLEYGSGAAPYAKFITSAWPSTQRVYPYDIPSLLQRYASQYCMLAVGVENPLDCDWDGIVCTEVFEHLEHPLATANQMMEAAPIVCFDFIDDGHPERKDTLAAFRAYGRLSGPDARGLYVWRRNA